MRGGSKREKHAHLMQNKSEKRKVTVKRRIRQHKLLRARLKKISLNAVR